MVVSIRNRRIYHVAPAVEYWIYRDPIRRIKDCRTPGSVAPLYREVWVRGPDRTKKEILKSQSPSTSAT